MTDTYDGRPPPVIPGNSGGYQGPPPYGPPPDFSGGWNQSPAPKKKSKMWILWLFISLLVLVAFCGGVATVFGGSNSPDPKPQKSVTNSHSQRAVAPTPSKVNTSLPAPVPVGFTDRDTPALVGKDIPPGVYRVAENIDELSGKCFYTKSHDSEGRDIIDNGYFDKGRPQVTLKSGQWIRSEDCGTWQPVTVK